MKVAPGDTLAEEPTETLTVPRELFPELIRQCPEITATLVHVMVDRARQFTSSDLHDEKMKSLGKLAAGLAHELNNPASAVVRSAKSLAEGLAEAEEASRALGAAAADARRSARRWTQCATPALARARPGARSTIEEADRVDSISEWLEARGADASLAGPLAETAVTLPALDRLAEALRGAAAGRGAALGRARMRRALPLPVKSRRRAPGSTSSWRP